MNKEITINGKLFVIEKLPLRKYADLLAALEQLPKHFQDLAGKKSEEIYPILPKLLAECYPDVVRLLTVATPMSPEEVDEMGLDDAVMALTAVMEVNNYNNVYEQIKKLMALNKPKQLES